MSSVLLPAGSEPLISVVICTRDRADLLKKAITSVLEQDAPPPAFEILVVDNASSDHTVEVVRGFAANSCVRLLQEPEGGISVARNTGWRAARGRYVAYLDDDVIALPGWIRAVRDALEMASPGIVGGRVTPIWERDPPAWLTEAVATALAVIDWGDATHPIQDLQREWLVSANFAIPRLLLKEIGGFNPALGRIGNSRMFTNEDILLQREIMRRGYRCLYHPPMAVMHWVPTTRLSKGWLSRRFYWQGVGDAVTEMIEDAPPLHQRLARALSRVGALLFSPHKLKSLLLAVDEPSAVTRRCLALHDLGYVAGLLGAGGR
jgi:glycosyltransferase involved in cell wall biosynthesis